MTLLSIWSEVQMNCICSSACHCHPIISCFIKMADCFNASLPRCPGKEVIKQVSVLYGTMQKSAVKSYKRDCGSTWQLPKVMRTTSTPSWTTTVCSLSGLGLRHFNGPTTIQPTTICCSSSRGLFNSFAIAPTSLTLTLRRPTRSCSFRTSTSRATAFYGIKPLISSCWTVYTFTITKLRCSLHVEFSNADTETATQLTTPDT